MAFVLNQAGRAGCGLQSQMARLYEKPLTLDIGHSRVLHFLSMSELACGRDNYLQALSFPFIYSNAHCTMVESKIVHRKINYFADWRELQGSNGLYVEANYSLNPWVPLYFPTDRHP